MIICDHCGKEKQGVKTGLCNHCGRFGKPNKTIMKTFTIIRWGESHECELQKTKYHDGNIAILLTYGGGRPYCKLSVNMPEHSHNLNEGEFFVKDWFENEELPEQLEALGIIEFCNKVIDGVRVFKLKGEWAL